MVISSLIFSQEEIEKLLEMDLSELLSVKVISGTKIPQTIHEIPATVRIIDKKKLIENGYFTIEQVLSDLPGFQFRNIVGFNSYIFLRGIPNQNNLIILMVDGIPLNELNSGGFYAGGQFNLENIERIEVVYGPASSLYGTNAVSGIINIVTKNPEKKNEGKLNILKGNFKTFLSDFYYGYFNKDKNLKISISSMLKKSEKADLKGEKGDFMWTEEMENFEDDWEFYGKIFYKKFSTGILIQDKNASRATVQKTFGTNLSDHGINWHIRFLNFYTKYVFIENDEILLQTLAYYRNTEVMDDTIPVIELETEESPGKQYRYYRPANILGQETIFNLRKFKRFNLIFGITSEKERLSKSYSISTSNSQYEKPEKPKKPEMMTNELYSFFIQSKFSLGNFLNLFLGIRYDDSNYYGNVATPRAGIIFKKKKLTGKFLYMEAFRAPKPWDYTDGIGNKNLKPEEMNSYELSFIYDFSKNLQIESSFYKNLIENLLFKEFIDDKWRWINYGKIKTNGFELFLKYAKGKFKSSIDYTFNDSKDQNKKQIPEISKNSFGFTFGYFFNKNFNLNFRCRYFGDRKNPKIIYSTGKDKIEDALVFYTNFNLSLKNGLSFQISIDNIFDKEYYHPSNLPPDWYRQPERTIRLKFGYEF